MRVVLVFVCCPVLAIHSIELFEMGGVLTEVALPANNVVIKMRSQFSSCFIVSVFRSRSGMRQQQFALMYIGTVDPLLTPPSVAHCAMADAMCMNCMTCNSGYALCGGACVTPRLFWTFGLRQSSSHHQFMSPHAAFPNCAMMDPMCMMCKACNSGYILCNKACYAARSFSMRYFKSK